MSQCAFFPRGRRDCRAGGGGSGLGEGWGASKQPFSGERPIAAAVCEIPPTKLPHTCPQNADGLRGRRSHRWRGGGQNLGLKKGVRGGANQCAFFSRRGLRDRRPEKEKDPRGSRMGGDPFFRSMALCVCGISIPKLPPPVSSERRAGSKDLRPFSPQPV